MTSRPPATGAALLFGLFAAGAVVYATGQTGVGDEAAARVPLASFLEARRLSAEAPPPGTDPHAGIGPVDPGVRARIDSLRARVASDAGDDGARLQLARLLAASHESAGSIAAFRAYLRDNASDAGAWLDLGRVLFATGDRDGATSAMHAALRIDPSRAEALYNLGAIAANEGRMDEAAAWWRRVVGESGDTAMVRRATTSLDRIGVAP